MKLPGEEEFEKEAKKIAKLPKGNKSGRIIDLASAIGRPQVRTPIQKAATNAINRLDRADSNPWDDNILSVDAWLNSYYHSGPIGQDLWPHSTRKDVANIGRKFGRYNYAIITGSIGSGKSSTGVGVALWTLYILSKMKNPHRFLGMGRMSKIAIVITSLNKTKAQKTIYGDMVRALRHCEYYSREFPWNKDKESVLEFPKSIEVYPDTCDPDSLASVNPILIIMDEVNDWEYVEQSKRARATDRTLDLAQAYFDAAELRQISRFQGREGHKALIMVMCQERYPDSFIPRLYRKMREKIGKNVFYVRRAIWEAKPRSKYSDEMFKFELGSEKHPGRILKGDETDVSGEVIEVPETLREQFETKPEESTRDLAGRSTQSIARFLTNVEQIENIYRTTAKWDISQVEAACTKVETTLMNDGFCWVPHRLAKRQAGRMLPVVSPETPRFIHIDPSISGDATGFCMVHRYDVVDVEKVDERTGDVTRTRENSFYVDLALRILPPRGAEISFRAVIGLIKQLRDEYAFDIALITADHRAMSKYYSDELTALGFGVTYLSADIDSGPYDYLKECIQEERVSCHWHEHLHKELKALERNKFTRKIDHPPKGSKDISDALACSIASCNRYNPVHYVHAGGDIQATIY